MTLSGVDLPPAILNEAPRNQPRLTLTAVFDADPAATPDDDALTAGHALIALPGGGWADTTRAPAAATLHLPAPVAPTALVHPFMAGVCATHAHWRGALTMHAGAVVIDGAAWGVLGGKGLGKSTTLATFAAAGFGVLSDDLVIVDDGRAFAGPRCIDLRRSAGAYFPGAEPLGMVGLRHRWRLPLAAVPWSVPMGGWMALEWGDAFAADTVPAGERVRLLGASLALAVRPPRPSEFLDAAALPMLRLTRPRDLDRLPELIAPVTRYVAG